MNKPQPNADLGGCIKSLGLKYIKKDHHIQSRILQANTFPTAQADSSQELVADQSLLVPHGQLQTHLLQLLQAELLINKYVVVMRVQVVLHQPGLPLRALRLDREQVAADAQTQLLLVYSVGV